MGFEDALPAPGLEVFSPTLRRLPRADLLKIVQMRLRFAMVPSRNPMRLFAPTRTILVRVPKNASSSLTALLYPGARAEQLPHYSAEFYRRVFPRQYRDWFVVAPMREPMDRLASAFTYYRETTTVPQERHLMDEELPFLKTFADFVHWLNDQPDLTAPRIMQWHHFRRQSAFICDQAGRILTDLLFAVEKMGPALERLGRRNGIDRPLPRLNASRARNLSGLPLERLRRFYACDTAIWERCMREACLEGPG